MKNKYQQAFIVFDGEFNDVLESSVDSFPPKMGRKNKNNKNNIICTWRDYLHIVDAWRFYHRNVKEYTWE